MGDRHLLMQNGLSGMIMAVFFMYALWVFNACLATKFMCFFIDKWQLIVAVIALPLLGFIAYILKLFALNIIEVLPYEDVGRIEVSSRLKQAIHKSDSIPAGLKEEMKLSPPDSMFIWFYYT